MELLSVVSRWDMQHDSLNMYLTAYANLVFPLPHNHPVYPASSPRPQHTSIVPCTLHPGVRSDLVGVIWAFQTVSADLVPRALLLIARREEVCPRVWNAQIRRRPHALLKRARRALSACRLALGSAGVAATVATGRGLVALTCMATDRMTAL